MKHQTTYMAISQYNETVHGLRHPRKDLMARHYVKHAEKMYCDKKDGTTVHVGYIVAKHWYTLYKVEPVENAL